MIKTYALVDSSVNLVQKLIYWNGESPFKVHDMPETFELVALDNPVSWVWDFNEARDDLVLTRVEGRLPSPGMEWDGSEFRQPLTTKPPLPQVNSSGVEEV